MNNKSKNQRIAFSFPEEITTVDVIHEILENNGLPESNQEYVDKLTKEVEPRMKIARDAAIAMFEKKVPENKVAELLAKHLETSPEIAKKIVVDINQKLIPYAKVITDEEEPKRETAKPAAPTPPPPKMPYSKKIEIPNVEENAANMEKSEQLQKARTVIPQPETPKPQGAPDPYKEPIE